MGFKAKLGHRLVLNSPLNDLAYIRNTWTWFIQKKPMINEHIKSWNPTTPQPPIHGGVVVHSWEHWGCWWWWPSWLIRVEWVPPLWSLYNFYPNPRLFDISEFPLITQQPLQLFYPHQLYIHYYPINSLVKLYLLNSLIVF